MDRFQGKVALVTGGASGIGAAVSRAWRPRVRASCSSTRTGTAPPRSPSVWAATSIPSRPTCRARGDVAALHARRGRALRAHRPLPPERRHRRRAGPAPEATVDDFDRVLAVNVRGIFLGMREAFRQYAAQESMGAIVTSASICSFGGGADIVAYHTSKHAILGLMRSCGRLRRAARDPRERRRARHRPDQPAAGSRRHRAGTAGTSARARLAPLRRAGSRTRSPPSSPSC